ncbi:hypothetical protein A3F28_03960 [Candidatus Uhrbacteria bacterium RIFCSPHIGHO2_12_FULL_57_11]|uniref:Bile acid:sodium symporter n=2 Tax=Candidatus Uhriibacteriota TaxID=1752732 RepID=A0A1F7UND4_9BACT|nr:MAG: hypothetical protein A3D72_00910 [Candidatus Uhrbacteria bacterium RIFCSPHIGHO2_02_FULL_57_19]OGL79782.1 MAG: hypothetical protein A3F28_03960 [Candidatus Uhrbacteria bacterium RIFCSPHIGHO2_12_FULL_57_11]
MKLLLKLLESYIVVLAVSLGVGLFSPQFGQRLTPWTTFFLQVIFFLSSLKLEFRAVAKEAKNFRAVALVNIYTLVVFPIITYILARMVVPRYALPLLLLAAMPAGMTTPLLTEIVGGSVGLALVLTMTTSLLAPITVPLAVKLLAGSEVVVPALKIFWSLLTVIVVPFALAQIVRLVLRERIKATFFTFKPVSIVLLGLLIVGVVSQRATEIKSNVGLFVGAIVVLAFFFALLHLAGYWGVPGLSHPQRLAVTVSLTYMNFTLAIYLAGKFFPQPEVLIPVILSVFPWSIGIIPFRMMMKKSH